MSKLLIGTVKNGFFNLLLPKPETVTKMRLTSTGLQDAVPPENGELNLIEYENTAIAIEGYSNGEWIYSANVVDTGDPIVSTLVEYVLGR